MVKNSLGLFVVVLLLYGCINPFLPPSPLQNTSVNTTLNATNMTQTLGCGDGMCISPENCTTCNADCGACKLIASGTPKILINEILFDAEGMDAGQELIELYNPGQSAVNLNGWTLVNSNRTVIATFPSIIFSADSYLIIYLKNGTNQLDFSNGSGRYYTGTPSELLSNSADAIALYNGTPSAETIKDFVRWGNGSCLEAGPYTDAVSAGIWRSGDCFDLATNTVFEGESIGRDMFSTDTTSSADWFSDGGVNAHGITPGKDNNALNIYDRSISGIVKDKRGNALTGVKVAVRDTSIETYTDSDGIYYLLEVPAGNHNLLFIKDGYAPSIKPVVVTTHRPVSSSPTLIPVSSDKTAVGPAGGVIRKSNVTIEIPVGALDREVNITITHLPAGYFLPEKQGKLGLVLGAIYFEPSGLIFNKAVNMTVPLSYLNGPKGNLSTNVTPGDNITIMSFNPTTMTWAEPITGKVNSDNLTASFETTHFTVIIEDTGSNVYWVSVADDGHSNLPKVYEKNAWCGNTVEVDEAKTMSATVVGDPGIGHELLSAKLGFNVNGKIEKKTKQSFTAGKCEELKIYSSWVVRTYNGRTWYWKPITFRLFEKPGPFDDPNNPPVGFRYYGDFKILVPEGIELSAEKIDRTSECCPMNKTKTSKTRHIKPVDTYGNIFGSVTLEPGETLEFAAMGYNAEGGETGYPLVSMKSTGTLDSSVSYITDSYYSYTPNKEGQGTIAMKDGQGHFTQIAVTVTRSK